jgi:hypothetical protein
MELRARRRSTRYDPSDCALPPTVSTTEKTFRLRLRRSSQMREPLEIGQSETTARRFETDWLGGSVTARLSPKTETRGLAQLFVRVS